MGFEFMRYTGTVNLINIYSIGINFVKLILSSNLTTIPVDFKTISVP
jgi:hypothetical protein